MPLEVTTRPEKTLQNDFLSRFNGSRTPLIYGFQSDLYPVNSVDAIGNITNIQYLANKLGTEVTFSGFIPALNINVNDFIEIKGTNTSLDDNVYLVKEITGNSSLIISSTYTGVYGGSGTLQRNYKGYKGLAKVYVGSPFYHPYNSSIKPEYLAGEIEIEFNSDNEGVANVRDFIKPDIDSKFDSEYQNNRYAWTSFFIEYGETWDNKTDEVVYTRDSLENCVPFVNFTDPEFNNGLDFWDTSTTGQFTSAWSVSANDTVTSTTSNGVGTQLIGQDKSLLINNFYNITVNLSSVTGSHALFIKNENEDNITAAQVISSGGVYQFDFTPSFDVTTVNIALFPLSSGGTVVLDSVNITANSGQVSPCDYSSFAVFGTKQFQDSLGGNFGDYVLNKVDAEITPKILTHFENIRLFYTNKDINGNLTNFKNYVSAVIPASLFYLSDGADNVYLEFNTFDEQNNPLDVAVRIKVDNLSDGVYTIDLDSLVLSDFDSGYCQFIYLPANTFLDADSGTFEDDNTANWNISTVAPFGAAITLISTHPRTGTYAGGFTISVNGVNPSGVYESFDFDTPVETVVGRTYELKAYIYNDANVSPSLNENLNVFLKLKGTNIESNKYFVSYADVDNEYKELYLTFEATQTSYQVTLCTELINDSPDIAAGGTITLDDITFKGPIDYASEQKPILLDRNCKGKYKSNTLRWLNDLGGWEQWVFKQYETVTENYQRTEIKKDIFTDFDEYFINGESQYKTNSVKSRQNITLRSNLLTADELKNVSQLRRSIEVQILTDANKWQTVSIKSGSFVIIEENENMHEVVFDVQLPETLVQEI